jgi:hypothetical protein
MLSTFLLTFLAIGASSSSVQNQETKPNKPKEITRPKLIIPKSDQTIPKGNLELFNFPGVVVFKNGKWAGSDNFLNISKKFAVQVNFEKPKDLKLSFNESDFQQRLIKALEKSGVEVIQSGTDLTPPLPFFNVVIMIYPTNDGFTALCSGNLYEKVELTRLKLNQGEVFQAITWQQVNLVYAEKENFEDNLNKAFDSLADNFLKRLATYQKQAS